ncbi:MAG: Na+/H+ antiporter NhaA [Myxococcota bacterium]|nr:Na+/H+ antiporter NhaA [Myxococcota bacterium]
MAEPPPTETPSSDVPSGEISRTSLPLPPGAWDPAARLVRSALRPVESFLHIEASGGILLMIAAVIALGWASSPWRLSYEHLLEAPVVLQVGAYELLTADLHFVINELLMTLFFFVVGLEIKREIRHGELSELRRAALPIAAAIGGMVAPALIYIAFNPSGPARSGWGVPMATDIAFAVGVLTLLGRRVPPALRVLLLTLAIVDDIGAVLVIAVFYSSGIALGGFVLVAIGILITMILQKTGVRAVWIYVIPGVIVWEGLHLAGVHPTLAGVLLGLLTPAHAWLGPERLIAIAGRSLTRISALVSSGRARPAELHDPLRDIQTARQEAISPVERLAAGLHPVVAWLIVPLFALANAGVPLDSADLHGPAIPVMVGIVAGLVVGKPVGVLLGVGLVVLLRISPLPKGVTWGGVAIVGMVAGIGFTMAIFVGDLAIAREMLDEAKLAILAASVIAGVATLVLGAIVLKPSELAGAARTESEAESSTDA